MYVHKKMKTTKESALEVLKELLPLLEAQEDYTNDALYALLLSICGRKRAARTAMCCGRFVLRFPVSR